MFIKSRRQLASEHLPIPIVWMLFASILVVTSAEADVYPGQAAFNADQSVITMPKGTVSLFFDTSQCEGCRDSLPPWRFIGDLKVDSIKLYAIRGRSMTTELSDASQLDGVKIVSKDLIAVLRKLKVVRLIKRAPMFAPSDTLFWDSVTNRWVNTPDLSTAYRLIFDESIDPDSAVNWLRQVPGLIDANKLDRPLEPMEIEPEDTPESAPESPVRGPGRSMRSDPWTPDDPLYPQQWQHRGRQTSPSAP